MKIKYFLINHSLEEKRDNDIAPIYGISLADLDGELSQPPYCMSKQLKEFSIAMQKYGLAWSERYHEYIIPDEICLNKDKLKEYICLIENTLTKLNRGETIVNEDELNRERSQSYYTKKYAIKYLQEVFRWNLGEKNNPIILDPAAGEGRLTDGIEVPKSSIWLIEPNKKCCELLKQKGYVHIINTSFEEAVASQLFPRPTHIIMNPPFSKQQDIKFYNLACRLLKDNGVISAIISENSIYDELHEIEQYGLYLDDTMPAKRANDILTSVHSKQLSSQMIEFLANIARSKHLCVDYVTGEVDFENTNARAMFFRGLVREREKIKENCKNSLYEFDGR